MKDPNANPTENPTEAEFDITQEMIDIARESIASEEEDYNPQQQVRSRLRLFHIIWVLAALIFLLIGVDRGAVLL